ncbi:MAG: bifunctional demethylmenaquinone methyltransferase/2-methoxy-6-polyprenyl-1,4-benzoquinol methylase [Legionellales bacterium]|nr:bifunctional demethylmenaquinone methyltransferase/2-methoxy-6-polyprenyl-1,4-benzoquinol methylase [Legionellales bacterium]HAV93829.1 bifunctional demethylmenaquinone methyltransferase/2-methoxy-6-polyprenyl-1,4-benzoquinol methylase [Pseudomonadota bacterium]
MVDNANNNSLRATEKPQDKKTSFGRQSVSSQEKTEKVQGVFDRSAQHYDLMNQIMSLGMHHSWKRKAVESAQIFPMDYTLDLACGTCDITQYVLEKSPDSYVFALDPNASMLHSGRDRLLDIGIHSAVNYVQGFAEHLPFADASFDHVFCAFGFRNFTDQHKGIAECARVLKPGGQVTIVEFAKPKSKFINLAFQQYARLIPPIGGLIASTADSYQYLIESIESNMPHQELAKLMHACHLTPAEATTYFSGLVYIQRGLKC